jgi:hypothetical protein
LFRFSEKIDMPLSFRKTPLAERIRQSTHNRFEIGSIPIRCTLIFRTAKMRSSLSGLRHLNRNFQIQKSIKDKNFKKKKKVRLKFILNIFN